MQPSARPKAPISVIEKAGSYMKLSHNLRPARIKHIQSSPTASVFVWSGLLTIASLPPGDCCAGNCLGEERAMRLGRRKRAGCQSEQI
jgi:hypothetical protein